MLNSRIKIALVLLATTAIIYSCSDDDQPSEKGNLKISAKSTMTSTRINTTEKNISNSNVEITKLLLNLKEFELEVDIDDQIEDLTQNDQDWDDDGTLDSKDEIELEGPFELDLLSGQISILDLVVPAGKYEELEFKFGPSTNNTSELFGKSILIEGKIADVPFKYSHKFTEEVEVDFEDPNFDIIISEVDQGIVIDFDVSLLFDSVKGVDLSKAVDGNNDGIIEIDHEDTDGNKILANLIKEKLIDTLELLDD